MTPYLKISVNELAEKSEKMIDILNHHRIPLTDIFKYGVIEPVYLDESCQPTEELHYLIVIYLPNQPTQHYIVQSVN